MWCLHTHRHTHRKRGEYYLAMKKNEILPFATTWMDQGDIILSEVSQTEEGKYQIIHLHLESKRNILQLNLCKKETDSHRKQTSLPMEEGHIRSMGLTNTNCSTCNR